MDAPTAAELQANPVVRDALEQAWLDSLSGDPVLRHEEGGWIYMDLTSGVVSVQRAPPGYGASIVLDFPPLVPGSVVVGVFHTHPNPSAEGWDPGPSPSDHMMDHLNGVPDLIRSDSGIFHSGPDRLRGSLSGNSGYPD
jgi:hypothetical protein